ncbi:MAG: sporulation protein [Candidatus Marinimicrobia bacterium]|nr:sporulation protein [Candidatus Neomarinimicrobiota bacterium]MCF7828173.1 sporulation protein [Candidatus Neomarinimicrobiota bacterium]MCF7879652.1 sporulation protein [Candidatus Neomarinimicrobiota bacterium]
MIEELIKSVLPELRQIAKGQTVVGEPIQAGDSTVIPVSKVSVGFGAGGGGSEKDNGQGSGTGGGASIEPVAFIVITDGKVQLVPLTSKDTTIGKVIDMVPEILDRVGLKGQGPKQSDEETPDDEPVEEEGSDG